MSTIEVKTFKRDDGTGFITVRLWSVVKGNVISFKDLEINDIGSPRALADAAEVTGGALAEYQNEQYGDRHDPSQCAALAREAFTEMWAELTG